MFQMTNGDANRRKTIDAQNNVRVRHFLLSTAISFAMNVVAGIVVAIYWPSGT